MDRRWILLTGGAALLSACASPAREVPMGADGKPLPRVYQIDEGETAEID